MTKKDKLRTVARPSGQNGAYVCAICGETAELRHAEILLQDGAPPRGAYRRVCESCADAMPAGASDKLRARAEDAPESERRALLALADQVAQIDASDWASAKDMRWAAVQFERGFRPVEVHKKRDTAKTQVAKFQRYRKGA